MNWQTFFFRLLGGFLVGFSASWLIYASWSRCLGARKLFEKDYLARHEDLVSREEGSSND